MRDLFARDLKRVQRLTKLTVQQRLRERSAMPMNELLTACGMLDNARHGELLLKELGAIVDVDPTVFRPRDQMGELFSIDTTTLGAEANAVLKKYGMNSMGVFGEDILQMLTKFCDAEAWERIWRSLPERPRNDDEWIDVIMEWTVSDFLTTFASAFVLYSR